MFSWFSRKFSQSKPHPSVERPNEAADAPAPVRKPAQDHKSTENVTNQKNERMERRELLYAVVRDAMMSAGVLTASYKFKVLSLDQRGRQFLVMMDLAREFAGESARLSEIEALIVQTAKARHDTVVTAVYWRINDHMAVGISQKGVAPQGASLPAGPAVHVHSTHPAVPVSQVTNATPPVPTATVAPTRPDAAAARPSQRFDPIEADEVAAFKRALSDSAGARATPTAAVKPGVPVRSGPLLPPSRPTGFEDTVVQVADGISPDLSTTQYGDLT